MTIKHISKIYKRFVKKVTRLLVTGHDNTGIFCRWPIFQQVTKNGTGRGQDAFVGADLPSVAVEGDVGKEFFLHAVVQSSFDAQSAAFGPDQHSGTFHDGRALLPTNWITKAKTSRK